MLIVYTAVLGGSDTLKSAPTGFDRCVCLTDDPLLVGAGWTMQAWTPRLAPRADSRWIKTHPHVLFPAAQQTVWVDASMTMTAPGRLLRDVGTADCAAFRHPTSRTVREEVAATIKANQGSPAQLWQQAAVYRASGFRPATLTAAGLLVRTRTATTSAFNELWWIEQTRWGYNDQLALDYAAWAVSLPIHHLHGSHWQNPYLTYDVRDHHARRQRGWAP